jgi:hypothetical protein
MEEERLAQREGKDLHVGGPEKSVGFFFPLSSSLYNIHAHCTHTHILSSTIYGRLANLRCVVVPVVWPLKSALLPPPLLNYWAALARDGFWPTNVSINYVRGCGEGPSWSEGRWRRAKEEKEGGRPLHCR